MHLNFTGLEQLKTEKKWSEWGLNKGKRCFKKIFLKVFSCGRDLCVSIRWLEWRERKFGFMWKLLSSIWTKDSYENLFLDPFVICVLFTQKFIEGNTQLKVKRKKKQGQFLSTRNIPNKVLKLEFLFFILLFFRFKHENFTSRYFWGFNQKLQINRKRKRKTKF